MTKVIGSMLNPVADIDSVEMECACGATMVTQGWSGWVTERMRMFMAVHKDHTPWTGPESKEADDGTGTDAQAG